MDDYNPLRTLFLEERLYPFVSAVIVYQYEPVSVKIRMLLYAFKAFFQIV